MMDDEAAIQITVVVVDDDPFARDALCRMISDPMIHVIPVSGNNEECLKAVERNLPRVVITDVHPEDEIETSTRLIRDITATYPSTSCLVLAASDPTGSLLLAAFFAGAHGCLRKGSVPHKGMAKLVKQLAAGEYVLDPRVAADLLRRPRSGRVPRVAAILSRQESQILRHLATGTRLAELAHLTGISETSVKGIIRNLAEKIRRDYAVEPFHFRSGSSATISSALVEEVAPWPTRHTLA